MKYKHFAKHILDVMLANTPAKHSTLIIRVEQGRIDTNFLQHEVKESFYPESEQNNKKTPLTGNYTERQKNFIIWCQKEHRDGYYAISAYEGYPTHVVRLLLAPELDLILKYLQALPKH